MWWIAALRQFWPVLPALIICWFLHSGAMARNDAYWQKQLDLKAKQLQRECDADKQLTETIDHDYQDKITALNVQLSRAQHVRPRTCVVPLPSALAASRFNDAAAGRKPAVAHGVTSEALLEFGSDSEKTRIQLIGLQDFIRRTWASRP